MGLGQPYLGVELIVRKNMEMWMRMIGAIGCTGLRSGVSVSAVWNVS